MESPIKTYKKSLAKADRSPEFKERTLAYARELTEKGLPIIFSPKHLAIHLGIDYGELKDRIDCSEDYYHYFLISKKNGGKRRVIAPSATMREVQAWIKSAILDKQEVKECVTGFVKKKSVLDNARPHVNKKYVLKCDIKDFFESINIHAVSAIFHKMGYTRQVAYALAALCTTKICKWRYDQLEDEEQEAFGPLFGKDAAFLVQGAATSPGIANLVCARMDKRLMGYCERHNVSYTRYADDMTFSADRKEDLPSMAFLRKVLHKYDFEMNDEKTQLLTSKGRQYVTGLLVDGRVRVPGKYKKEIYRHLHFCLKYGGHSHFNRLASEKAFGREWLYGKIYYVNAIEPEEAKKMLKMADEVNWFK